MIQKPTVQELLEHAENRYSLVIATSRRARQIAKGDSPKIESNDKSPVTIAANEIAQGKVKVYKYGADQTCAISGVTFELIKNQQKKN